MYIEVFLLDNTVMNFIILRIASAMCSVKTPLRRLFFASFLGAVFAAFAVQQPMLCALPAKLVTAGLMSLALPNDRSARSLLINYCAILTAAFAAGGLTLCVATLISAGEGRVFAFTALDIRAAMASVLLCALLPTAVRRLLARRHTGQLTLSMTLNDKTYTFNALVDTGNMLVEPLSGLPVIVAYLPQIKYSGGLPVPVSTVNGTTMLYAFAPHKICVKDGYELSALVALTDMPLKAALVPPAALRSYHV